MGEIVLFEDCVVLGSSSLRFRPEQLYRDPSIAIAPTG